MEHFWDIAASLGQGGAGAILALVVVFYFQSRNKKGAPASFCQAHSVQSVMQNSLDTQTGLLREIKDSQKETRDGVKELIVIQRQQHNG